MSNIIKIISFLFLTEVILGQLQHQEDKKGGICFRIDDNQTISKYSQYAEVFNNNDVNFTYALNLDKIQITEDYIDLVKNLQSHGHEMMDHTPNHMTNYFNTNLDINYFLNHPGVESISGNKVELKHKDVNTADAKRNGIISVNGNIVTSASGIFSEFSKYDCYLFFPSLNKLVYISKWIDDNTVKVSSVWQSSIDLGCRSNIKFYNFNNSNVHLTIDAIKALAEETLRLADYYGIQRPTSWIQPGGYFPRLHPDELKNALSDLGYNAGGVFANPSLKVFNEYDSDNDKQFGMNWGDFFEDTTPLEELKNFIADRVAKHQVLIGHSHFSGLLDEWDGYLQRTDDLIKWCINYDIPIRTYTEWADQLYKKNSDPLQNILPSLSTDNDGNNYPDGFSKKVLSSNGKFYLDGEWITDDGVAESDFHSFRINKVGNICYVGRTNWWENDGLAGVEKGENEFEIWTKGSTGNFIEVDFNIGNNHCIFKFPAENSEWTKYNLSQSVNGNNTLSIPENISLIDVTIRSSNYISGNISVSGMRLYKKKQTIEFTLDLKILLEGPYLESKLMTRNSNFLLPASQPYYIEPWSYNGNETITATLNTNIIDWVLISLFNDLENESPIVQQAALLKKDGNIVSLDGYSLPHFNLPNQDYYVQVEHRNHLKVISANKIKLGE